MSTLLTLTLEEQKVFESIREAGTTTARVLEEKLTIPFPKIMAISRKLEEEGVISIEELKLTKYVLTEEGKKYAREGLPEHRLYKLLKERGSLRVSEIPFEEKNIALVWLSKKGVIKIEQGIIRLIGRISSWPEEDILIKLSVGEKIEEIPKVLLKRKLVEKIEKRDYKLIITEKGRRAKLKIVEEVSFLTPDLIISGKWRDVKFKGYTLDVPVKVHYPAKIHPLVELIEEIREIFIEMGFEEIIGPLVETAFFNFDVLFQPQDHPAREMHDTFYIVGEGDIPKRICKNVKLTHENGWKTGSKGWGYTWDERIAKKLLLRTHTTAATARSLISLKPPVKYFCIDRVYRNEKVDYKHLAEFHQIEGIAAYENASFRDLMGLLTTFYNKLGFKKVKFWPSYFPYTEPSAEAVVYHPEFGWLELMGMGIFRPEVTIPLGIKVPVLAWGGGLERLLMLKLKFKDIRIPYKNALSWLREV